LRLSSTYTPDDAALMLWFDSDDAVGRHNLDGLFARATPAVKDTIAVVPVLDHQALLVRRAAHAAEAGSVAKVLLDVTRIRGKHRLDHWAHDAQRSIRLGVRQAG
jgi:hypothetical protein